MFDSITYSRKIRMIHQLHRRLFFGNLDVFHELLFGLVVRDFHNSDSRNTSSNIRCSIAVSRMVFCKVAFISRMRFFLRSLRITLRSFP